MTAIVDKDVEDQFDENDKLVPSASFSFKLAREVEQKERRLRLELARDILDILLGRD